MHTALREIVGNDPSPALPLTTDAAVGPGHSGFVGGIALRSVPSTPDRGP